MGNPRLEPVSFPHLGAEWALTVREPWASSIMAVAAGWKNIENRSRGSLHWAARLIGNRMWVHAGKGWSTSGAIDERVCSLFDAIICQARDFPHAGHVLGSVLVDDVHEASGCCEPWGEATYLDSDRRTVAGVTHLVLVDPVPLDTPVPAKGQLGLWRWSPPAAG